MNTRKVALYLVAFLLFAVILAACRRQEVEVTRVVEQEVTRVVTETEVVESELAEATRVVTEVLEVTTEAEEVMEEVEAHPVTYDSFSTTDIPSLDPQVAEEVISINNIESLFVHLTNYDLFTGEVVPEAATDWTISEDGLTYTFNIRTDIPWVKHNPVTGETVQEVDEEGKPRFVTAGDFEYGIKRACDPNIGSYDIKALAPVIVGCEDVLNAEDPNDEVAVAALQDAVGVTAIDDSTLEVNLAFQASYFLSMTPMWTLAATPSWAIAQHGNDEWTEAGRIVTNGRFVLHEWVHDVRRILLRNPLMPGDMVGEGNFERMVTTVVPDTSTGYTLWLNNEVDTASIPDEELEAHLELFADETIQVPDLDVFYISFRESKSPFDDPRVRRAFSAAFDRATFVSEVRQGRGLAMTHFAPPGIFGAPPIDEVGIDFNPEFARAQLAEAGYPNCEGFPQVSLLGYSGESILQWIEYAQGQWQEHLGCSSDLITIEQKTSSELLTLTSAETPDTEAPHMWTLGWRPDYADENNWVGDVLWCGNAGNRQKRGCNEIDDMIVEARKETEPARRIELYRKIEEMFFGEEGEIPFFPIFVRSAFVAEHSWLDDVRALFGGEQYYNWTIDQGAKLATRIE